jgi:hypothetical protein
MQNEKVHKNIFFVCFFLMYNYILYQIKFMLSTSHETQDDDFNFVEPQATIKLYGYPKKILKNTTLFYPHQLLILMITNRVYAFSNCCPVIVLRLPCIGQWPVG